MRIAEGCVEENIGQARALDVDGLVCDVGEDDAGGVDAPLGCLRLDEGLPIGREAQQPQHAVRHPLQDVAPEKSKMTYFEPEFQGSQAAGFGSLNEM